MAIRILLVDDHDLVRAGFRSLLENLDEIEVVGEAGNGRDAIELAGRLCPNVVLMDLMLPVLNGLDATAQIVKNQPATRVIILSMNAGQEFVFPAMRSGASGYLLKNVTLAELELAIRAVAAGKIHLTSAVSGQLVADWRRHSDDTGNSLERLSPRQREVLQQIAEGSTTKQIARTLGVSIKTIETYRAQLMTSLEIHDIAGLTRFAVRMGLVSADH